MQISGGEGSKSLLRELSRIVARQAVNEQERTGQEYRVDPAAQLIGQGSRVEGWRHDKCRDARHSRARGMRFVGKKENPVDDPVDGVEMVVQIGKRAALAGDVDEVR